MMRSLFSGVSGLKVHQTKMDVIGNNISNVNTVGFKGSTVNFSDIFYQTTQGASAPNDETGTAGRNALQIGLGANLASVTANITGQGGAQRTDNPFDVMINGDGFFIVNSGGSNYFTKAGAFNVDANGNLCTPTGAYVMGWQATADGLGITKDSVSPLRVMSAENKHTPPEATTAARVSGNLDKSDTSASPAGKGLMKQITFYDSRGSQYTAQVLIKQNAANSNLYNVTLQDVKDVNGQSIFIKKVVNAATGAVTYEKNTEIDNITLGGTSYSVVAADINPTTGAIAKLTPAAAAGATGGTVNGPILAFDGDTGKFQQIDNAYNAGALTGVKAVDLKINAATGAPNPYSTVSVDFSTITNFESGGKSTLETETGIDGKGAGKKLGNMIGISIGPDGRITGSYDNGDKKLLGQIAVARFANPSGLEAVGNNMFAETQNSGSFDGIGQDPSTEGDSLSTGQLEMSNVDLSSEFTSMITTQRGFQANSRIITTSDTMLEELINLKR